MGLCFLALGGAHIVSAASATGVWRIVAEQGGRAVTLVVVLIPLLASIALLAAYRPSLTALALLAWLAAGWALRRELPDGISCGCLPPVVELRVPKILTALFPEILAGPPRGAGTDDQDTRIALLPF